MVDASWSATLAYGAAFAAADVEHAAHLRRRLQRQPAGAGDIADVDEVAALRAVLEYPRAVAVQEARGKDGEHPGVGVRQRLAGAIDVEETQRDGWDAVGLADQEAHAFLGVFVEGVDRPQRWTFFLGRRRSPAAARRHCRSDPSRPAWSRDGSRSAVIADLATAGEIAAFAVDAHRGGDDQPAHPAFEQGLHQRRRTQLVDRGVPLDFIHALADARLRPPDAARRPRRAVRGSSAVPFRTSPKM